MKNNMQRQAWQIALSDAITDSAELLQILALDSAFLAPAQKAAAQFGLRVPRAFVRRMQKGDPNDPLLRQVLPLGEECLDMPGYVADPLQERQANRVPGLLHKYRNRVLLTLTSSCGIHCRYCFRREFPYAENNPGQAGWSNALAYINERPEISEIILSGGDPLVVTDKVLQRFSEKLLAISHIHTLRIHTRMPIVIPERITKAFVHWLSQLPLQKVMVIHCNHPQELNSDVRAALSQLKNINLTLLNQSVLLKNINDQADILIALSNALFAAGVLPYYLHLLDKVQGTAHFDSDERGAKNIIKTMQENLPGYLVPRLVRELPGEKHKVWV